MHKLNEIDNKLALQAPSTKSDHHCRLARQPPPPRDISALLDEIQAPGDLEKSPWATAFMRHLRTTDQERPTDDDSITLPSQFKFYLINSSCIPLIFHSLIPLLLKS